MKPKFIDEFQYATGRMALSGNLPDPAQLQVRTVVMRKEQVVKFRNDYKLLADFAALICGVPVETLHLGDILMTTIKFCESDSGGEGR